MFAQFQVFIRNTNAEWFQVLLFNINNSFQHNSFICTESNGSKHCTVKYSDVTRIILISIKHLFPHA